MYDLICICTYVYLTEHQSRLVSRILAAGLLISVLEQADVTNTNIHCLWERGNGTLDPRACHGNAWRKHTLLLVVFSRSLRHGRARGKKPCLSRLGSGEFGAEFGARLKKSRAKAAPRLLPFSLLGPLSCKRACVAKPPGAPPLHGIGTAACSAREANPSREQWKNSGPAWLVRSDAHVPRRSRLPGRGRGGRAPHPRALRRASVQEQVAARSRG